MGAMPSPITGSAGNIEFLLHARTPARPGGRGRWAPARAPSHGRPAPWPRPIVGGARVGGHGRDRLLHPPRSPRGGRAGRPGRAPGWPARATESIAALRADGSVSVDGADLLVSLGGDGTLLRAVDAALAAGDPGARSQHRPARLPDPGRARRTGERAGRFPGRDPPGGGADDPRGRPCRTRRGQLVARRTALNEATVEKTVPGHTVRIAALIDDRPFVTYAADGLLVSTPTGSTAYNLSARGPVLSPRLRAIVVTPVSPHMLFDRALVLDPERAAAPRGARAPRRRPGRRRGHRVPPSSRVPPSTAARATGRPGWSRSGPATSTPSSGPSSTWPTGRGTGAVGTHLVELRVRNLGVIDDVTVVAGAGDDRPHRRDRGRQDPAGRGPRPAPRGPGRSVGGAGRRRRGHGRGPVRRRSDRARCRR